MSTALSPRAVLVSTADACSVGCRFCFRADTGRDVLGTDMYARGLSRLRELGVEEVCLSGGEPTDHPQFRQLVRTTLQFGLRCSVVTAARPGRRLDALISAATMLSHVTVSADSVSAERLGRTGRDISSTAAVFAALGHRRASLHVTVHELSQDDIGAIRTVLDTAEVPLEVSPLLPSRSFRFENPHLERDLRGIEDLLGATPQLRSLVTEYQSFLDGQPPERECASQRLYLSADGKVRRCPYSTEGEVSVLEPRAAIRSAVQAMFDEPPLTGLSCAAICRSEHATETVEVSG